jgi:hypothetical protein
MPISNLRWVALSGAVLMALSVAACEPKAPPPLPAVGEKRIALETAACESQGGELSIFGGLSQCRLRPTDGGKSCQTGRDCEGDCLARSMTCAPISPLSGCNEIVTDTGARVTECVE